MTTIVFFVRPDEVDSLERAVELDRQQSIRDLCADHGRSPVFIDPENCPDPLGTILQVSPLQVMLRLRENPQRGEDPIHLDLARQLVDLGIDVLLLVRNSELGAYHFRRVAMEMPTVEVCDLNHLGSIVAPTIIVGNRFLLANPHTEEIRQQEEAHMAALRALLAAERLFAARKQLAQQRLGTI